MLLVIDIGNTTISIGCFERSDLRVTLQLKSDQHRPRDEYAALLLSLLERSLGKYPHFDAAIISSVVPPLTPEMVSLVKSLFALDPLVVGPGIKTGIALKVSEPAMLGGDRIANALAARELLGAPALVVDFSTATTFDYVNAEGNYEGLVIAPGIKSFPESLASRTAWLPRIDLVWPKTLLGKSSKSSMQAGTLVGYLCMVDGLIERLFREVGPIPHVVGTGPFGELCVPHSAGITSYDPDLTLRGLKLMAELNAR